MVQVAAIGAVFPALQRGFFTVPSNVLLFTQAVRAGHYFILHYIAHPNE